MKMFKLILFKKNLQTLSYLKRRIFWYCWLHQKYHGYECKHDSSYRVKARELWRFHTNFTLRGPNGRKKLQNQPQIIQTTKKRERFTIFKSQELHEALLKISQHLEGNLSQGPQQLGSTSSRVYLISCLMLLWDISL